MAKHALLSASSSQRWINCPPSARLEAEVKEKASEFAMEGTFAHALAELKLAHHFDHITKSKYNTELKKLKGDDFYSRGLEDDVQIYVDFAIEKINEAKSRTKDAVVLLEARLDYSPWVQEGFGTGDLVLITDGVLEIVDLKFGKGVQVSATDNSQMRLYALGAINGFGYLYDIDTVKMTIHQPRLDHISTSEISTDDLEYWATNTIMGAAQKAWEGKGEFKAGDWCRFCKIRATCRARAEANLELAKHDFKAPPELTAEELVEVLSAADELQSWVSDVQAYALDQAINHGKEWPGYKLVEGRSSRKYADEVKVAEALKKAGYSEEQIFEKVLLGITKMEKMVGKKRFGEVLAGLIEKPPGKPKLTLASDKRPAIRSTAEIDFKEDM